MPAAPGGRAGAQAPAAGRLGSRRRTRVAVGANAVQRPDVEYWPALERRVASGSEAARAGRGLGRVRRGLPREEVRFLERCWSSRRRPDSVLCDSREVGQLVRLQEMSDQFDRGAVLEVKGYQRGLARRGKVRDVRPAQITSRAKRVRGTAYLAICAHLVLAATRLGYCSEVTGSSM